jgi:hypothetical protein
MRNSKINKIFPKLMSTLKDFNNNIKWEVKDYISDPDPCILNVYLILIKINGEWGYCIWHSVKNTFIEEPGTFEDYGTDIEKENKKFSWGIKIS